MPCGGTRSCCSESPQVHRVVLRRWAEPVDRGLLLLCGDALAEYVRLHLDDGPEWRAVSACAGCGREHSVSCEAFETRAAAEAERDRWQRQDAEYALWLGLGLPEEIAAALAFAEDESEHGN